MGRIDSQKPWVVLPLKSVKKSNSRLKYILSSNERQQLSMLMLEDVFAALKNVPGLGGLLVITDCPTIKHYCRKLDVILLEEGDRPELNSAVSKAVQFLEKLGIKRFFTVPGDVPLLDSSELNQLIECVKNSKGVTLVPSHDGLGTNSISSLIPSHITPQFGSNSLSIHHQMARDIGVPLNVLPLPGLGFDIDWPDDLIQLASIDGDSRSQRYLSRIDVIQRQSRASKQTTGIEFEQRD